MTWGVHSFFFSRELIGEGTNEKPEGGSSWSPPCMNARSFGPPGEREGAGPAAGGGVVLAAGGLRKTSTVSNAPWKENWNRG